MENSGKLVYVTVLLSLAYCCHGATVVSQGDLSSLMQSLWDADVNRLDIGQELLIDHQRRTFWSSNSDVAPGKFFTSVPDLTKKSTYRKFISLLDNYELHLAKPDAATTVEKDDQLTYLRSILGTRVWQLTRTYLYDSGLLSASEGLQDYLSYIWFTEYSRYQNTRGSSGFEHVFVGETRDFSKLSGLHSWIEFYRQENAGLVNYMGYGDYDSANQIYEIKMKYGSDIRDYPMKSMFVGVSPEFELAIYTVCFLARPDQECIFNMNGKGVRIQTYKMINYVATAYPKLS